VHRCDRDRDAHYRSDRRFRDTERTRRLGRDLVALSVPAEGEVKIGDKVWCLGSLGVIIDFGCRQNISCALVRWDDGHESWKAVEILTVVVNKKGNE